MKCRRTELTGTISEWPKALGPGSANKPERSEGGEAQPWVRHRFFRSPERAILPSTLYPLTPMPKAQGPSPLPSTLYPLPSTLSPQCPKPKAHPPYPLPSTLNPQPSTLNLHPQPSTLYPQPSMPKAQGPRPIPSTLYPLP